MQKLTHKKPAPEAKAEEIPAPELRLEILDNGGGDPKVVTGTEDEVVTNPEASIADPETVEDEPRPPPKPDERE